MERHAGPSADPGDGAIRRRMAVMSRLSPRRQVSLIQYVLVPHDQELAAAVPDGRETLFTDNERWSTPGAHPGMAVQYCLDDRDAAFARARSRAAAAGFAVDDLAVGPSLLTVDLSDDDAYDLTTPRSLKRAQLPATYPDDANTPAVRQSCRAAGDRLISAGEGLICTRPAEPQIRTHHEILAVLPRVTLAVTARTPWHEWSV